MFDKLELKHLLIPMAIGWIVCALFLIGSPMLAYVGLHLATTGVFVFFVTRIIREHEEKDLEERV